jgi:NAD/NADP transhydrogenase beta subunit
MSMNVVTLLYLVASVFFIQALKGLSHPTTSIRGNVFGMAGMAIAAVTTGALIAELAGSARGLSWVLLGLIFGGGYGAYRARTVEMTKMPELVAFFHSMIGLAAVFIAVAAVAEPYAMLQGLQKGDLIPTGNRLELFLGAAIGAITFSGSVIAFGKLSGTYRFRLFKGAPVVFPGQHKLNLVLGLLTIALGLVFVYNESWAAFFAMLVLSFVMGVLIIIPIGGADMPVVLVLQRDPGRIWRRGRASRGGGHRCAAAGQEWQRRRRCLCALERRNGRHCAGIWAGCGAGPACSQGIGRETHAQGHYRQVRDPPGCRPDAGPYECAAGRGGGAV